MTIFDAPPIKPAWKYRRLAIAVGAAVVIAAITITVLLRFHTERNSTLIRSGSLLRLTPFRILCRTGGRTVTTAL